MRLPETKPPLSLDEIINLRAELLEHEGLYCDNVPVEKVERLLDQCVVLMSQKEQLVALIKATAKRP